MHFPSQQGNGFRRSKLTVPLCIRCLVFTIPCIILTPLCTIQGALRCGPLHQSGPHPDAVYAQTPFTLSCSSPPTSVFNQLVPFISGNIGKKEFDWESLTPSLVFFFFQNQTSPAGQPPHQGWLVSKLWLSHFYSLVRVSLITGILFNRSPRLTKQWQTIKIEDIIASCWGFKRLNMLLTVLMQLAQGSG